MGMQTAKVVEAWEGGCQDRADVFETDTAVVIIVADGAGGASGGAKAADHVVAKVEDAANSDRDLLDPWLWLRVLKEVDEALVGDPVAGETTGVVAACGADKIAGASVGDSGCWLLTADGVQNLTERQRRRPLLGSGVAAPVPLEESFAAGTLVAASDGLWKYASMDRIAPLATGDGPEIAARKLVDLVRLRSGALQDDVSVILCRKDGG